MPLGGLVTDVLPHAFTGLATIDGVMVPDGTLVTAWLAGFEEPLAESITSNGSYLLIAPQYGSDSFAHRILTFRIAGLIAAETVPWVPGEVYDLDLTALSN